MLFKAFYTHANIEGLYCNAHPNRLPPGKEVVWTDNFGKCVYVCEKTHKRRILNVYQPVFWFSLLISARSSRVFLFLVLALSSLTFSASGLLRVSALSLSPPSEVFGQLWLSLCIIEVVTPTSCLIPGPLSLIDGQSKHWGLEWLTAYECVYVYACGSRHTQIWSCTRDCPYIHNVQMYI